ncbi:MAG: diguanylate cyclase [Thermodesulfobacteriota bacterium]
MDLILIVHKDAAVREELSSALSDAGCGTLAVGTAEEALGLMGDASFPAALIGLELPGMSGFDLLKEARRLHPEMESIVLPESPTLDVAVSCIQAGACDYLPGPYADRRKVIAAAERALERGRISRERRVELQNLAQRNEVLLATNHFLAEQVKRDGLTGLYNHAYFQEVLARETARAGRYNRTFSLLFADLDHFKRYNDLQGHQAGDKALVLAADIFRRSVRKSDYVARYGGEEFVIMLPETGKDKAQIVAERIRGAIANHPFPGREGQPGGALTISIGISSFPEDGMLPVELIRGADAALYTAKRGGGNAFRMAG